METAILLWIFIVYYKNDMKENFREYGSVLPCGGKGTRLRSLSRDEIPKSLLKIGGKELIRYSTDILSPDLVRRIVFAVDYKSEQIREWVAQENFPHILHFSEQTEPGVLGAITAGAHFVEEDEMIACNTDEVRLRLLLKNVTSYHEKSGRLATMVVTYANRLYRHRVLQVREVDSLVLKTRLKPDEYKKNPEAIGLINTGFLILNKRAIEHFDPKHNTDWGGIIDPLCDARQLGAYIDPTILYFNVGTPEEFYEAEQVLMQNPGESQSRNSTA